MDSLDTAALAFDAEIGNTPAPKSGGGAPQSRPAESLFDNLGTLEVDEDSPARGGGDDEEFGEELAARKQSRAPNGRFQSDDEDDEPSEDGEDVVEDEDEEGAKDDEDEEEGDSPEDDVYEVTVDGERVEVPLREALAGYIRQETFHRRMNQINEAARAIGSEAQTVAALRDEYVDLIDKMKRGIEALVPNDINWDELYKQDPAAARNLESRYRSFQDLLRGLDSEKENERARREQEVRENDAKYIQRENERILRNNPSWKDPKVRERDQSLMLQTALNAGYSVEDVAAIKDSRQVTILLKAAKYDRLMGNRPKPVRKGAKPRQLGGGNGTGRTAPKTDRGAMKALSRTGSVDAAASVFTNIISQENRRRK